MSEHDRVDNQVGRSTKERVFIEDSGFCKPTTLTFTTGMYYYHKQRSSRE